jgi:hypothetical protein
MGMIKEIKGLLTVGLLSGYIGGSVRGDTFRVGFPFETSDYQGPEGAYHDEWIVDKRSGGGQEVVETPDGNKFTRLYAGGTISEEEIVKLGISGEVVVERLIDFVREAGNQTRLNDCYQSTNGEWSYRYKIRKIEAEIGIIAAEEEVRYQDRMVFMHYHLLCPIK